jgi:Lantibiotic dehydratase, N terminus
MRTSGASYALLGSTWTLSEHMLMRSAGFPADGVLRLADLGLAESADRLMSESTLPQARHQAFTADWEAAVGVLSGNIRAIAESPIFRLAVSWQNPTVLETGIEPLLRKTGSSRDRKFRSHERLVASYWQRYCVKNDTIGFFGPLAWSRMAEETRITPGPDLISRARVHFETWAIDVLAATIQSEIDLDPWLMPRRTPLVQVVNGAVVEPGGTQVPEGSPVATALLLANGTLLARDLVARLIVDHPGLDTDRAYELLRALRDRRLIIWRLEVPSSIHPEAELEKILLRVESEQVRESALAKLRQLRAAGDRLQRVWSDADEIRAAHDAVSSVFRECTGEAGIRHHGDSYSGRTLTYLECERDISLELGPDFLAALAPVALILDSVRWLTWTIRESLMPHVLEAYERARRARPGMVTATALWTQCLPFIRRNLGQIVEAALGDYHKRLSACLPWPADARGVSFTLDELRPSFAANFPAPHSGWTEARWCSPDIMIASRSIADLVRNDFFLVLGELHVAINSCDYNAAVQSAPDQEDLLRFIDAVSPEPRLLPLLPKESLPRLTVRTHPALVRPYDYRVALTPQVPMATSGRFVSGGDLIVSLRHPGELLVTSDRHEFDVMDLFSESVKAALLEKFSLFADPYVPRLTVDRLVLAREKWKFTPASLAFANEKTESGRFVAARRWFLDADLPRHVYVKLPTEVKPFYVDFASPVCIEILATAIRRAVRAEPGNADSACVTVSEMLPDHNQLWLAHSNGKRFTSEFRIMAFDMSGR